MGFAQRGRLQKAADTKAAGRICLQDVDRTRVEHAAEVNTVVSVFARSDVHSRRSTLANEVQSFEILRRNRLLEPDDLRCCKLFRQRECLLARVAAVRGNV